MEQKEDKKMESKNNKDENLDIENGNEAPLVNNSDNEKSQEEEENTTQDESNIKTDESEKEILSLRDEKIRLLAEMENLRKRFEREKVDIIKFGSTNLARDILSPADNLERALDALPETEEYSQSIKNLIEGLRMVLKEFKSILEKHGVKKINTIKEKFDHNYHQAMMEIETDEVDEGVVIQEVQSGYTMHDRLLRAAMVGVSKKPNDNTNKNDENANKGSNEKDSVEKKDK